MPNVRELLESAVPYDTRGVLPAAEVRRLGRRRQRRSQAVGVVIGVTAVALSTVGIVRFVVPVADVARPATTVGPTARASSTPQPLPSPTGPELASLVGSRWLLDLVGSQVATQQAYPEDPGAAPRALMTFEPGHVLVVDYMEKGRTTTVRGTWIATSLTPALDEKARGDLRLTLTTPSHAPTVLLMLLNRLSLVSSFAMVVPDSTPPSSIAPLMMAAYSAVGGVASADLVKPGYVLPSPYPSRP
jgi:hypothetical protein